VGKIKLLLCLFLFFATNLSAKEFIYEFKSDSRVDKYEKLLMNPGLLVGLYDSLTIDKKFTYKIIDKSTVEIIFFKSTLPNALVSYKKRTQNTFEYVISIKPNQIDLLSFNIDLSVSLNKDKSQVIFNYPDLPFITDNMLQKGNLLISTYINEKNQNKIFDYLEGMNGGIYDEATIMVDLINNQTNIINSYSRSSERIMAPKQNIFITFMIFLLIMINFTAIFIIARRLSN
jgi:hypothetical protein